MADNDQKKRIKFRNYAPIDHTTTKSTGQKKDKTDNTDSETIQTKIINPESETSRVELDILTRELALNATDELNIVPKKPNWDLKNQISKSLEKLQRRTQKSIVEILQAKLDNEQNTDVEEEDDD